MEFDDLYKRALNVAFPFELSGSAKSGDVGAAILTEAGNIYTGVCIDTDCSMGFCAEHAAAAAMLTAHDNVIVKVVAVNCDGDIMPPCGRCREFLSQLSDRNMDALVMVGENTVVKLRDLLPHDWRMLKKTK